MTLDEFRKNNPEYNDIPDLELADRFYKKYYSDLDETEYYEKLFPNITSLILLNSSWFKKLSIIFISLLIILF